MASRGAPDFPASADCARLIGSMKEKIQGQRFDILSTGSMECSILILTSSSTPCQRQPQRRRRTACCGRNDGAFSRDRAVELAKLSQRKGHHPLISTSTRFHSCAGASSHLARGLRICCQSRELDFESDPPTKSLPPPASFTMFRCNARPIRFSSRRSFHLRE